MSPEQFARTMRIERHRCGFTLIELSIVLVIIGLIVGGVLVGLDLMEAAKVRATMSDIEKINTAAQTFRLKYGGLPGDITNATNIWGTDPGGCPAPYTATPHSETCNGNGDDKIYGAPYEVWRFFQQLANAGLWPGVFTGTFGTGGAFNGMAGLSVPTARISPVAGYCVQSQYLWDTTGWGAQTGWEASGKYGNVIVLGLADATASLCRLPIMTGLVAWLIDIKMDDGLPKSGVAQASAGSHGTFSLVGDVYDVIPAAEREVFMMFKAAF